MGIFRNSPFGKRNEDIEEFVKEGVWGGCWKMDFVVRSFFSRQRHSTSMPGDGVCGGSGKRKSSWRRRQRRNPGVFNGLHAISWILSKFYKNSTSKNLNCCGGV